MYACFKYACLYLFIWVCDYRSTWLSCMAFRRGLAHSGCVLWDDDLARREARSSGGFRNISWLLTRLLRPLMSSSCRLVSSPLLFSSLLLSFLVFSPLFSSPILSSPLFLLFSPFLSFRLLSYYFCIKTINAVSSLLFSPPPIFSCPDILFPIPSSPLLSFLLCSLFLFSHLLSSPLSLL